MTRRPGLTLAERSARSRPAEPPAQREPRHCWVLDPRDAAGKWPGVCRAWRRAERGTWEGLVAYAVPRGDQYALVEEWLPAAQLQEA